MFFKCSVSQGSNNIIKLIAGMKYCNETFTSLLEKSNHEADVVQLTSVFP